jgi:urease accessory protein
MNRAILTITLLLAGTPVFAHPFHVEHGGFVAGLLHPLAGIDHLLALLAVGLCAARQRALFPVFLAMMAAGAVAGKSGMRLPLLEGGIALTVLLAGLMAAAALRLPALPAETLAGVFALWHGNAHGLELPEWTAAGGFLLASAALLTVGSLLARSPLARVAGGVIAAAGVALLAL